MRIAPALVCRVLAPVLWMAAPAAAQERPADAGATQSFNAQFFSAFNPVTAEDMVRRVPGFTLRDGEDRRGFAGAAGNVLINGERLSSKVAVSEQLSRISARDVQSIDLRSGGADAADMRGESLLVDVRLKPRQRGATNTFVAQASLLEPGNTVNPIIIVNSGLGIGPANVILSVQAQPSRRGRVEYDRTLRAASGSVLEQADEFLQGSYQEYKFTGRAAIPLGGRDALNLNLQVTPSQDGRHTFSNVRTASGAPLRVETSNVEGDPAWSGEAGADWEHRFSGTSSFKLLGLARRKETGSNEAYTTAFATGARRITAIDRSASTGEYVGRAAYTFQPWSKHQAELALEGAFNYLDSGLSITDNTGLGPVRRVLPVANTRVEEDRLELQASDVWRVSRELVIDAGFGLESSTIRQTGDATQERHFSYFKPRVKVTYDPPGQDLWRLLVERDIAQLDFVEFASAISVFDGLVSIGNPNLEPEKTWRGQVDYERRWGAKGALVLSVFHDQVEDVQDQIPIAGQFDGPGNLGEGTRTGVRADVSAPLDGLGLKGAELRLRGQFQESSVRDPTTGERRRFSDEGDWSYSIDFRQPLPTYKLLWGVLYERADDISVYRLREERTTGWQDSNLDLYVETTAFKGLVVRATYQDIFLPEELRERRFFTPDRSRVQNLSSVEQRFATGGYGTRSIVLRVAGRF